MDTTKEVILEKTEKPALESKKMLAGIYGIGAVLVVWLGTLICMFVKTETASQFVSLATIVVSFIGAIITALITGQSAMEWKSMSTIAQVDTNEKEEKKIESIERKDIRQDIRLENHIIEEGQPGAPEVKPFSSSATKPG